MATGQSKLVFGCGYLGQRVAQRWLAGGNRVYCVTRSRRRADQLGSLGLEPIVADVTDVSSLADLPAAATVLFSVGFDRAAGQRIEDVLVAGLGNVLAALPASVHRLIYISSTGVYGQDDGSWVDEQSPCRPRRASGKAHLAAEQLLTRSPLAERSNILRLAGLYGPGRIPRGRRLAARSQLAARQQGYLNLIHVDDAADIVVAVDERAPAGRLYLVSDGCPVLRADYYREIQRLWGEPQQSAATQSRAASGVDRWVSNKRVSNRRLISELAVQLKYPNYREGLRAVAAAEGQIGSDGSGEPPQ